jgi:lysophospholipase L1-like esterase
VNLERIPLFGLEALAAAVLAGMGVLVVEALLSIRRGFLSAETAPHADGTIGPAGAPLLRLAVLGDSTAAGVGVARVDDTIGRQLARRLVRAGYQVQVSTVAIAGSRSVDLGPQVSRAILGRPHVAVVLIGTDDTRRRFRPAVMTDEIAAALERMQRHDIPVIVGTCPDLGAAPAWPRPLRWFLGWRGHRVAAAQRVGARNAGATVVDLDTSTGAIFRADPGTFSEDGCHPSADGYRLWTEALFPAVQQAARSHVTL